MPVVLIKMDKLQHPFASPTVWGNLICCHSYDLCVDTDYFDQDLFATISQYFRIQLYVRGAVWHLSKQICLLNIAAREELYQ